MRLPILIRVLAGVLPLLCAACGVKCPAPPPSPCRFSAPLATTLPDGFFTDTGDRDSLLAAARTSLAALRRQDQDKTVHVCGRAMPMRRLTDTLRAFTRIVEHTPPRRLAPAIGKAFTACRAGSGDNATGVLVTGYFQPRLRGSLTKRPPYIHPIHAPPPDLVNATFFAADGTARNIVGRIDHGRLVPYWTRAEIETGDRLSGSEILYLADPVDAFILQVQGSGVVELEDGRTILVRYAASNGRPYRSIGKLLADEGKIPLSEISLPAIRDYLHEHLDERQRILHYNERYIFFRAEEGAPAEPVGSMGERLVPGRSAALDSRCYQPGTLLFLRGTMPDGVAGKTTRPLSRFVFHHDTGAAIKGSGRLDLYLGSGRQAGRVAGRLKHPARLYILLKKETRP